MLADDLHEQITEAIRKAAHWCEGEGCPCLDDAPIVATTGRATDVVTVEGSPDALADVVVTALEIRRLAQATTESTEENTDG